MQTAKYDKESADPQMQKIKTMIESVQEAFEVRTETLNLHHFVSNEELDHK
jgi:hypothetical protein